MTATVLVETIVESTGPGPQTCQEVARATGSRGSIDQVADIDVPAQRKVPGTAQLVSFVATGPG